MERDCTMECDFCNCSYTVTCFFFADILTAGFTAEQLKVAGFDAQRVHAAMGLTAQAVHALGFGLQHQLV